MCMLLLMRRIQLHLDEDLDEALAAQAMELGLPKAALIRRYLAEHVSVRTRANEDPSASLIGVYDGTPDESRGIDDIVYRR